MANDILQGAASVSGIKFGVDDVSKVYQGVNEIWGASANIILLDQPNPNTAPDLAAWTQVNGSSIAILGTNITYDNASGLVGYAAILAGTANKIFRYTVTGAPGSNEVRQIVAEADNGVGADFGNSGSISNAVWDAGAPNSLVFSIPDVDFRVGISDNSAGVATRFTDTLVEELPTQVLYGRGAAWGYPIWQSGEESIFTPGANCTVGWSGSQLRPFFQIVGVGGRVECDLYLNDLPGYVAGKATTVRLNILTASDATGSYLLELRDNNGLAQTGNLVDNQFSSFVEGAQDNQGIGGDVGALSRFMLWTSSGQTANKFFYIDNMEVLQEI